MRPTLSAARGSSQHAAIAESLVTDAERSNRRLTCLLHVISDGTRVRHAQGITLSILRAFIACAATVQTAVLVLFGPSCSGYYRPLQCFQKTTCTGTKIKIFFIVVLIPKPFLEFPDKLIGKGCPTTGVLSTYRGHHIPWREKKGKKKKRCRARIMYCISIREEGNSLPEGTATAAQQSRLSQGDRQQKGSCCFGFTSPGLWLGIAWHKRRPCPREVGPKLRLV